MSIPANDWLTVKDVANKLNVSPAVVYNRVRRKKNPLPANRAFGTIRVNRRELEKWLEAAA